MKSKIPTFLDEHRITEGEWGSPRGSGMSGAYFVPYSKKTFLQILASDGDPELWKAAELPGDPWEHVSVLVFKPSDGNSPYVEAKRTPNWAEMDWVKRLFWEDTETAMQLHVPRSRHVNNNDFVLHIWKPRDKAIPLPPNSTV